MSRARRLRQRSGVRSALKPAIAKVRSGWIEALESRRLLSISMTPKDITPFENISASPVVATFTDTDPSPAADYSATIDWGDGTTDAGAAVTVSLTGSVFSVSGTHTYAEDGSYSVKTSVLENNGADVDSATGSSTATVLENAFGLTSGGTLTVAEGTPINNFLVATFHDPGSPDPASDYSADINWGDGTTSAGTVSGSSGDFTVNASHTYADEGKFSYAVSVKEAEANFNFGPVGSSITVTEADVLTAPPNASGSGLEHDPSFQVLVPFTDTNTSAVASDFTGTIDWGDGTTTSGTVSGGSGSLTVAGNHAYADEGVFIIHVILADDAPGTATATFTGTGTVTEADVLAGTGMSISATETLNFSAPVATFTDTDTTSLASDFTATIDWGDGTTTAGTVSGSAGNFTVNGGHTYAEDGSYTTKVTLADDAPGTATATATGTASVKEGFFSLSAGGSQTVVEGQVLNVPVAFISDPGSTDPASDFAASVDWGDGSTTAGTVSGSNGNYTVTASHTFADEGTFTPLIKVSEAEANFTIGPVGFVTTVTEGDVLIAPPNASGSGPEHDPTFQVTVPFTDTYAGNVPSDFTGTIDWGDGTVTAGTVSGGSGTLTVQGNHAYADEGVFIIHVVLADDAPGTASATFTGTGTVTEADVLAGTGLSINALEQSSFSGAVATFTDTDTISPASDFTASIDWGDGTTTAGTVSGSAGNFTVNGGHTYAEDGNYTVKTVLADDVPGTATATATGTAAVGESVLAMSGIGTTLSGVEGTPFSGLLATASDPGSPDPASSFSANIIWGDGSTTAGTVSGSGGNYSISANHVFTEETNGNVTVTFFENSDPGFTISVTDPINITDAPLSSTGTTILTVEGQTFNNKVVAHFTDANPNPDVLDFSANIDWGDGTSSVGTIASNGAGGFDVSGSHQYLEQAANLPVTVTIKDIGGSTTIAHSAASIADAPLTPTSGQIVNATEGLQLTNVVLGGFTDADPNGQPADYSVTINWGDGSPTSAGVVTANGPGFDVSGTHTYADEGMYLPIITVNDEGGFALGGFTTTLNAKVLVGDAQLTATGTPVSAVEGASATVQVASFTDANPAAPLSDFSATIDWGDGTAPSPGTITQPGGLGQPFIVTGTHTYAEEGTFTVTTSIKDIGGSTATATSKATVTDAPLTLSPQTFPFLLEGAGFTGPIATLFDADPGGTPGDYTVTVDWGDGTSSAGSVGAGGPFLTGSQFQINGGHTYEEEGVYSVKVTVADAGGAKAYLTEQALVIDAPLSGVGKILNGTEAAQFSGPVASFSDADPHGAVGDYIATIDWGDGHIGVGVIVANGAGGFDVTGKHTYAEEGTYPVTASVHDGGSSTVINSVINVADAAVVATGAAPLAAVEGLSTPSITLATFTDPGGPEVLSDYSASINWGDASSSPLTITLNGGVFTVSGSHAYAEEGNYSTILTIHHDTAPDTIVNGSAVVADAPLSGTGKILAATEGLLFNGTVGSFVDANPNPDITDLSATIDWGDGITTAGVVTPNGIGGFNVGGAHTYEEEANALPIKIVVNDFGGATTTINSAINIADAPLSSAGVPLAGQQEGNTFSGTVASFVDADPHGTPSDYNATIDWGDGTTTNGIVSTDGVGGFNVQASHIYSEEGHYAIITSIKDVGGASTTALTFINIAEAPIAAVAQNLSLKQNQPFAGLVGSMFDANPFEPPGDYNIMVNWGDGSAPSPALATPTAVPGHYALNASHTYTSSGLFSMIITVQDDGAIATIVSGLVAVAPAPVADHLSSVAGKTISVMEGHTFNGNVASFVDSNLSTGAGAFSASIDWGDGNVTGGTVVKDSAGHFHVNGSHAYAEQGSYSTTITITGAASATAHGAAKVADAPLTAGAALTLHLKAGVSFSGTVGNFIDGDPLNTLASDYKATINWGDGKTSTAGFALTSTGHWKVLGTHTYAKKGTYHLSLTILDAGSSVKLTATVIVS